MTRKNRLLTSTMNYPAEARVIKVERNTVNIYMSRSFSSDIDDLSMNIILGINLLDPSTMYGNQNDRNMYIDLR